MLAIGDVEGRTLEAMAVQLAEHFAMPCEVMPNAIDPEFAFHPERGQYHSSEILAEIRKFVGPNCWRLLGVTSADLYIPILTFVFGEAQMGGPAAVISTHRLRQEFYGLPKDVDLSIRPDAEEEVHELGHAHLSPCDDYNYGMASSHSVEWIDLKENTFCRHCANRVLAELSRPH